MTFVVDEDDVQLVATNALAAIDKHRASLLRQGIDIPRRGAIAYQLAWTRRNEFLWISWEKWIDYGRVIGVTTRMCRIPRCGQPASRGGTIRHVAPTSRV